MCNCNGHTSDPRVVVASADFHDLKVLHSVGGTAPRQSTLLRLMAQADRTDRHRAPAQGAFVSDLCIPQLVTGFQPEAARATSIAACDRWRSNGGSSSRGAENCLRLRFLRQSQRVGRAHLSDLPTLALAENGPTGAQFGALAQKRAAVGRTSWFTRRRPSGDFYDLRKLWPGSIRYHIELAAIPEA